MIKVVLVATQLDLITGTIGKLLGGAGMITPGITLVLSIKYLVNFRKDLNPNALGVGGRSAWLHTRNIDKLLGGADMMISGITLVKSL
jgi:hypothetical protein